MTFAAPLRLETVRCTTTLLTFLELHQTTETHANEFYATRGLLLMSQRLHDTSDEAGVRLSPACQLWEAANDLHTNLNAELTQHALP